MERSWAIYTSSITLYYFPCEWEGKESAYNAQDPSSIPGSGRSPGVGNNKQLTPVFLPGEFHGQRSLAGYSPSGCKESDTTEQLTLLLPR